MNIDANPKTVTALALLADALAVGGLAYFLIDAINKPSTSNTVFAAVWAGWVYAGTEYAKNRARSVINITAEKVTVGHESNASNPD